MERTIRATIRTNIAMLISVASRFSAFAIDVEIKLATPTGVNLKNEKTINFNISSVTYKNNCYH